MRTSRIFTVVIFFIMAVSTGFILAYIESNSSYSVAIHQLLQIRYFLVVLISFIIIAFIHLISSRKTILFNIFRYRWQIGLISLIILTLFEISGANWPNTEGVVGDIASHIIYGIPRAIRSDEYIVSTPAVLSQVSSGLNPVSSVIRGAPTDVTLIQFQPCWHPIILLHPSYWGYLFLGAAKGISFYWNFRFIILFLVSIEFAYRILCKNNQFLSILYACFIVFSPAHQWWSGGPTEIVAFSQLGILCVPMYSKCKNYIQKFAVSLLFSWCAGTVVITFYPAWLITFFYIYLPIFIYTLFVYRQQIQYGWKDLLILFIAASPIVAIISYTMMGATEVLNIVSNTSYPGERISLGGDRTYFFNWILAPLQLIKPNSLSPNVSELSEYYAATPLVIIMTYYCIKNKIFDRLTIAIGIGMLILLIYLLIGLPLPIAKVLMLSRTFPERAAFVFSYATMLLLFRNLRLLRYKINISKKIAAGTSIIIPPILLIVELLFGHVDVTSLTIFDIFVFCSINTLILYGIFNLITRNQPSSLAHTLAIWSIILCGIFVNPLVIGAGRITTGGVWDSIRSIHLSNQEHARGDLWAGVYANGNIPIVVGAPTVNSVNPYPNLTRWHILDSNGKYNNIYNRYAHIDIELTTSEDSPVFTLIQPDYFKVTLNLDQLANIGVTNVISNEGNLNSYNSERHKLTLLKHVGNIYIYNLI